MKSLLPRLCILLLLLSIPSLTHAAVMCSSSCSALQSYVTDCVPSKIYVTANTIVYPFTTSNNPSLKLSCTKLSAKPTAVLQFQVRNNGRYTIYTSQEGESGVEFDSVLEIRSCDTGEILGCNDDQSGSLAASVQVDLSQYTKYLAFVQGPSEINFRLGFGETEPPTIFSTKSPTPPTVYIPAATDTASTWAGLIIGCVFIFIFLILCGWCFCAKKFSRRGGGTPTYAPKPPPTWNDADIDAQNQQQQQQGPSIPLAVEKVVDGIPVAVPVGENAMRENPPVAEEVCGNNQSDQSINPPARQQHTTELTYV